MNFLRKSHAAHFLLANLSVLTFVGKVLNTTSKTNLHLVNPPSIH